jgi:ribosomal protein S18 acetylase RimI-like enzyme
MAELTTCEVTPATLADAPLLARMSKNYIERGLRWRWRTPQMRRKIAAPDTVVLAAEVHAGGTRLVGGFAVMDFIMDADRDKAILNLLAVHPKIRRMGVGRKLVRWLHKSAAVAGCEYIELQVRSDNQGARRFYRDLGYADEALLPGYYDGKVSAYQMKLRLHSA